VRQNRLGHDIGHAEFRQFGAHCPAQIVQCPGRHRFNLGAARSLAADLFDEAIEALLKC
jgi:hypothetical protein